MEARFQTHLKSSTTRTQPSSDAPSVLADGFDFDPLFLEESWSLGLPAALQNHQRRQQHKADQEDQLRTLCEGHTLSTLHFLEDRESYIPDTRNITSQAWAPQDWIPQDRVTQSWIPQGWTPEYAPVREPQPQPQPFAELHDTTMTPQRARLLLEVTAVDTREQIRSAYRRMVGQWHPDRLQLTSEAIRTHATRHMAALNEAYRLLCAIELEQAA